MLFFGHSPSYEDIWREYESVLGESSDLMIWPWPDPNEERDAEIQRLLEENARLKSDKKSLEKELSELRKDQ